MIPYGKQNISQADIDAVIGVLKSDFITQGPKIAEFEQAICTYTAAKHSIAVNSATAALHIACLALGVGDGDEVWTSPNSFVASANCALYCSASVDFVDISPRTYNICSDALEAKLKTAKKLPKVVIPVHFAGQAPNMQKIYELSKQYGFKIIEDASHAIGASYQNAKVGNCQYSDITIFSFHPVKIITTGEGGIATTNSPELAAKMAQLRTHGIVKTDLWQYEQTELGYNYRITDICAALGLSQMQRLDEFIEKRHKIAAVYNQKLAGLPITLPYQRADAVSSYHLYPILVDANKRKEIFKKLRAAEIGVNVHYIPIHTQPYYKNMGFNWGNFPNAEEYYNRTISLPMFPDLTEQQQEFVVDRVKEFCN